jgi:hypothetical protein
VIWTGSIFWFNKILGKFCVRGSFSRRTEPHEVMLVRGVVVSPMPNPQPGEPGATFCMAPTL